MKTVFYVFVNHLQKIGSLLSGHRCVPELQTWTQQHWHDMI